MLSGAICTDSVNWRFREKVSHGNVKRFRDNKNSYLSKLVRFFSWSSTSSRKTVDESGDSSSTESSRSELRDQPHQASSCQRRPTWQSLLTKLCWRRQKISSRKASGATYATTSSGYPGYGGPGGLAPQLGHWERSSRYPGSVRLS